MPEQLSGTPSFQCAQQYGLPGRMDLVQCPSSEITCILNREKLKKLSALPRNINHFQADLIKGFLNEYLSTGSDGILGVPVTAFAKH